MKYPAPRRFQSLFAAAAFGILLAACTHSTFAQAKQAKSGSNAGKRFSKPNAVPKGISASDWAGIPAAASGGDKQISPNEP
jgi:hypothetical protein